jgi:hypothetical protein
VLPDIPNTPDHHKQAWNKNDASIKLIRLTVIVENKIAAQEYAVDCQQQEGKCSP